MKYGNVIFCGKSGEDYRFEAWSLQTRFRAVPAVYFITCRGVGNANYNRADHEHIYVGETDSLAGPLGTSAQLACFMEHGANCVCVYPVENEVRRHAIYQDLLAAHPTLCNEGSRERIWFDTRAVAGPPKPQP